MSCLLLFFFFRSGLICHSRLRWNNWCPLETLASLPVRLSLHGLCFFPSDVRSARSCFVSARVAPRSRTHLDRWRPSVSRYCLSGLPVDCQMKNISSPDQTSLLLEDLIIWTNYEIEVAAYNGAGRGTYSHKVTEWTLQGGEACSMSPFPIFCPPSQKKISNIAIMPAPSPTTLAHFWVFYMSEMKLFCLNLTNIPSKKTECLAETSAASLLTAGTRNSGAPVSANTSTYT